MPVATHKKLGGPAGLVLASYRRLMRETGNPQDDTIRDALLCMAIVGLMHGRWRVEQDRIEADQPAHVSPNEYLDLYEKIGEFIGL